MTAAEHPRVEPPAPAAGPPAREPVLPGLAWRGLVVLGVLVTGALASGLLPAGSPPFVLAGAAGAWLLGVSGAAFKLRALDTATAAEARGRDPRLGTGRLQAALLGDFLIHLVVVAGAMFGMSRMSVKFPSIVGFGLAFATGALTMQLLAGLALARASRSRSHSAPRPGSSPNAGDAGRTASHPPVSD